MMKRNILAVVIPALLVACNDPLKSCSGHNEWRSQT